MTVAGQIAFLPILVLSARLCPKGIEATFFALLMSIINLSSLLSHELGALLTHWLGVTETNFDNLWLLVVMTNLSTLLPLLLIGWLPNADPQTQEKEAKQESIKLAEIYENHPLGSLPTDSAMPEFFPDFVTTKKQV